MRRAAWIVPTSLVLTGWVGLMWAFRPGWGFCADAIEGGESFCAQGTFSLGAIVGTIVLAALLVVFVVLVVRLKGQLRVPVLVSALVALGLVCLIMGYLAEFVIHESIPPPP
jgi:hypothetical protein